MKYYNYREIILKELDPARFYNDYGYKLKGENTTVKCCLPGHDDSNPSLSINSETGYFNCFGCERKGDMIQWYIHHNRLDFKPAALQIIEKYNLIPVENKIRKNDVVKQKAESVDIKLVEDCYKALPADIRTYLNNRGIPDYLIEKYKLGWGEFHDKHWITIPGKNNEGKYALLKLRKAPNEDGTDAPKMLVYPKGAKQEIFDYETLHSNTEVILCEGEFDKLVLEAQGIPAITFTGGAGTFKEEWKEHFRGLVKAKKLTKITVCYDNDEPGKKGAEKAVKTLLEIEDLSVCNIELPEMTAGYKDITDYLVHEKGDIKKLIANSVKVTKLGDAEPRIKKVSKPDKEVSFTEWKETIKKNFPDCVFAAEVCLSVIAQILITDITNPFALVLVDVPSAGKTITLNFFAGIEDMTYSTDKFSPASFVSNATNVRKEELSKIDLLPRIRHKTLIVRDLATVFGEREEDLLKSMGTLTRILDGEGLQTDSGVHGQRQYVGEYLFMFLAASTPIMPRVWKLMGNLGSRLFFLCMNSRDKSENELAEQLTSGSYKKKETHCRKITRDFLLTLWNKYPNGVNWNKGVENNNNLLIIARAAKLLARLRGTINVYKPHESEKYEHNNVVVEKPDRINQLFYNLCRGHALVNDIMQINKDDLKLIIELAIDSAPPVRAKLFRKLLEKEGKMRTTEVEVALQCSKPTALKEMETLKLLSLAYITTDEIKGFGQDEKVINLASDLDWFLSEECREIRGLPLPERQHTLADLL